MTGPSGRHWVQGVYTILALLGVSPDRIKANYELDDGRVLIAIPDTRVAISTEGDVTDPFVMAKWTVIPIQRNQMVAIDSALSALETVVFEDRRKTKVSTTKKTSKDEGVLLDAILRAGISRPERNHRLTRDDGKELTTPDFVWPEFKLAFFVDGLWWHQTKDDTEILDSFKDDGNRTVLLEGNKTRAERDGEIRSQMQADGWVVLSCTDRALEDPEEVERQVSRISEVMARVRKEKEILAGAVRQERPKSRIADLL